MSTPINPNAPAFEQKALRAIHERDEKAYASLFGGGDGKGSYLHKARILGKSLAYLKDLRSRGLVIIQREGGDAKAVLTDKGKAEIGV